LPDLSLVLYNLFYFNAQGASMRLLFLITTVFFLSACVNSDTVEVPSSTEEKSTTEILSNQSDAQEARDEYKKLQEQRERE
jgi:outer membrane lipoprotein-sorting protein